MCNMKTIWKGEYDDFIEELVETEKAWQKYVAKCIDDATEQLPFGVKKEIREFSAADINFDAFVDISKRARKIMYSK